MPQFETDDFVMDVAPEKMQAVIDKSAEKGIQGKWRFEYVNPETRKSEWVDSDKVNEAKAKGYIPLNVLQAKAQVPKPEMGRAMSALTGFANAATLGAAPTIAGALEGVHTTINKVPDVLGGVGKAAKEWYNQPAGTSEDIAGPWSRNVSPVLQEIPKAAQGAADDFRLAREAAQEQHPTVYLGGSLVPAAAQMVASPMTPLAQAGLNTAEGAFAGGFDPLMQGETQEAAKGALIGGGLGLGLSVLGNKVQNVLVDRATKQAPKWAAKSAGGNIVKWTRRAERMPGGIEDYGQELLDQNIVGFGTKAPKMLERASALKDHAGPAIRGTVEKMDKIAQTPAVSTARIRNRIITEVMKPLEKQAANNPLAAKVNAYLKDYTTKYTPQGMNIPGKQSMVSQWEERAALDKLAYNQQGLDKPFNLELQKIRRIIEDEILSSAQKAKVPQETIDKYIKTKRIYQVANEASQSLQDKVNRAQTNRTMSLTDTIMGAGALGGVGVSAATQNPMGALTSVGAAGLAMLINKVARERGPQMAAVINNKLSLLGRSNPQALSNILASFERTGQINLEGVE